MKDQSNGVPWGYVSIHGTNEFAIERRLRVEGTRAEVTSHARFRNCAQCRPRAMSELSLYAQDAVASVSHVPGSFEEATWASTFCCGLSVVRGLRERVSIIRFQQP